MGYFDRSINDRWMKKTSGYNYVFNPFKNDWDRQAFQGTTGFWLRVSPGVLSGNKVRWVVLSGYCLWDSMRWWEGYTINSNKTPTIAGISDAEKRFLDTYVPISIEYDEVNKIVLGCFWNFKSGTNEYYPFRISFSKTAISDEDGDYWNWDVGDMDIMDGSNLNFSNKIASLKAVSPIDTKCVLVDEANLDGTVKIANLKNFISGDNLFKFNLGS
jgi:hypothetical protein